MIVHQIYFDFGNVTNESNLEEAKRMLREVERHLPSDWRYMRWGLVEATRFLQAHYPCFLPILDLKTAFPVIKCDFFRYLLMYHFGGVYFDLDFVPTKGMDRLLADLEKKRVLFFPTNKSSPSVVLSEEWENSTEFSGTLHNGILLSKTEKHPFWMQLIMQIYDTLCVRCEIPTSYEEVYKRTGPKFLCAMAKANWDRYTDMVILPHFYCCPYVALHKVTKETVLCAGPGKVPSLETHDWVFFDSTIVPSICESCPESYFACVHMQHGSLWKKDLR